MKNYFVVLMVALMCATASMPASAKTGKNDLMSLVPENIIVRQTTHFSDGRTLTIYWKKQGSQCEVYSPCNEKDYQTNDVQKVKSTNFEVVDKVEGRLYRKASLTEVLRLLRQLASQYL